MAGYLPVLPKMEAPEFIESDIAADYEVGVVLCCVVLCECLLLLGCLHMYCFSLKVTLLLR